jgi:hypothetical protein
LTYTHTNLILGHSYSYKVAASNFLGYGPYSSVFTFTPTTIPGKPTSAPSNVAASTTQSTIYITYGSVSDDGGSAITNYNIYIDDGQNGVLAGPYSNALLLTYNTAALSALTAGYIYRLAYSA